LTKARSECEKLMASAAAADLSLLQGYHDYLTAKVAALA